MTHCRHHRSVPHYSIDSENVSHHLIGFKPPTIIGGSLSPQKATSELRTRLSICPWAKSWLEWWTLFTLLWLMCNSLALPAEILSTCAHGIITDVVQFLNKRAGAIKWIYKRLSCESGRPCGFRQVVATLHLQYRDNTTDLPYRAAQDARELRENLKIAVWGDCQSKNGISKTCK